MKKTVFTLSVDNYAPEITRLTFPFLRHYAQKIGARFQVIDKRKFPGFPPVYEKFQVHTLGKGNDWNIFVDADCLIHPDFFDVTEHLGKDTVMHNAIDLAGNRWRYDNYFRRDGRHISSCNWFTVASDWCLDLWQPLTDLTCKQAVSNIYPIRKEQLSGIPANHLIDDYVISRNIARFGLKVVCLRDLLPKLGRTGDEYLWHNYTDSVEKKIAMLREILKVWKL